MHRFITVFSGLKYTSNIIIDSFTVEAVSDPVKKFERFKQYSGSEAMMVLKFSPQGTTHIQDRFNYFKLS